MGFQRVWLVGILVALILVIALVSAGLAASGEPATNATNTSAIRTTGNDLQKGAATLNDQSATIITRDEEDQYRTRLVLLGTTGGVSWWPDTNHTSSSSALVVGDTIYVIDLGQGSAIRLAQAFNSGSFVQSPGGAIENGSSTFLENARALFFTHLHQDHTSDYPALLLIGPGGPGSAPPSTPRRTGRSTSPSG